MVFGRGTIRKSKSGSREESSSESDESYSSNSDSYYKGRNLRDVMSYSYDKHEVTREQYEAENYYYEDRYAEKRCCSIPKLAVFFIFLGLTFGLVFGLVDLDRINGIINGGDNSTGTDPTDDRIVFDDDTAEPYEFMQCPAVGECCNGLESNCDLAPHKMMWATVHNANHDDLLVSNNEAPLEEALEAGYRGLMIDVCRCKDEEGNWVLQFCHLLCGIGYRDPFEVFTNIESFLDRNPTEVVMINFEISNGNPTPEQLWSIADSVPGLREKTYVHRAGRIPVLRNVLANGRQLILYKHNGNNCNEENAQGCTPRIAEYFNTVIETQYSFKDVDAVSDSSESCWPFRGVDGRKDFYSINNFVTGPLGPSKLAAQTINKEAYLKKRLLDCEAVTGYVPNIIAVDFWQIGDVVKVVQEVNISRGSVVAVSLMSRIQKWFHGD
mmetsp:Transcript_12502/g.15849  ORF Transcript_12502/g.15849 Transcript_12502/m.15849 type:complete len:439 (-) Transcript_12502:189-1505(-)|eukprot:CAMPEP_0203688698 /NCGR_PEP_ID=MMETSP0091-20130426/1308_1 /ASSEMBLY_ACC=CAM_ASM_001089 /TAXON_ID=426623 /ORGANISM="Chaetoceros affinis, Strain CCMP159" /LENGTH=438 /DNA_ID=CAMNT_0050558249 /DNA_START=111 /DNA_END=1427 /DNA_ORIENTATION=-